MKKYRKKPVVIEAVQYTGDNLEELRDFVPESFRNNKINEPLGIITLEGVMTVSVGDWIIKGVAGEFYPCKPDIFEASYEIAPIFMQEIGTVLTEEEEKISMADATYRALKDDF